MHVAAIALTPALASPGAFLERISAQAQTTSAMKPSSRRMADGKRTTENLNVSIVPSLCFEDAEKNCGRYGRLYIWESGRRLIALGRDLEGQRADDHVDHTLHEEASAGEQFEPAEPGHESVGAAGRFKLTR